MKNPLHNFLGKLFFLTKKQTKESKIYIEHRKGCTCPECIQKWLDSDPFYGKIEAYELALPERSSILFLNKKINVKGE